MWNLRRAQGAKSSYALQSVRGDLEEVAIRDGVAYLKKAAVSGGLAWEGQKLVCDLLAPYFLELSAFLDGTQALIEASLVRGSSRISLAKCVQLFPAPTPIVLAPPFLYLIDADLRLIQKFLSGSTVLSCEEWEAIKCDCDEDVQIIEEGSAEAQLSLPKLTLTDEAGAFGTTEGREWIQDLLDVGYVKQQNGFYCPSDRVNFAISKLLEKGWEVESAQGEQVVLQREVAVESETVRFGEEDVPFGDLQLRAHSPFVSLSESSVGLIDRETLPVEYLGRKEPLSKIEKISLAGLPLKKIEEVLPGKGFKGKLFAYQQKGVSWLHFLYQNGLHGILADEMGLGKSVQLLAFFSGLKMPLSCLIVVPTSLLGNWQREAHRFWPEADLYLYHGEDRDSQALQNKPLVLTSYAILRRDIEQIKKMHWNVVALDEAQVIKNPKSQTFQAAVTLQADFRLSITGTPIENHLSDIWAQFHFLLPGLLGPKPQPFHPERIAPFILRRTKDDVELDLPEKLEQIVYVDMSEEQSRLYDAMVEKVRHEESLSQIEILERLLRLRQICCDPRLLSEGSCKSAKLERLMSDLEELKGKKILIYSQFTQMLGLIARELDDRGFTHLYLDGATKNRMELVDKFQNDPNANIFLISLKAGGVGLNLTAADYVLIYDPWWNEAVENQAIDRAHRIGKEGTVIARRYVTLRSLEEKIMQIKERKRALTGHMLDLSSEISLENLILEEVEGAHRSCGQAFQVPPLLGS